MRPLPPRPEEVKAGTYPDSERSWRPAELMGRAVTLAQAHPGSDTAALSACIIAAQFVMVGGVDPARLKPDLPLPTAPEVRRLAMAVAPHRPPRPDAALRWSTGQRRHQQRARRAHWRRRT